MGYASPGMALLNASQLFWLAMAQYGGIRKTRRKGWVCGRKDVALTRKVWVQGCGGAEAGGLRSGDPGDEVLHGEFNSGQDMDDGELRGEQSPLCLPINRSWDCK